MTRHQNDAWQTWVRELLAQGFGVEDIAIKTKSAVEHVRREVSILRQEGRLRDIVRPKKS